MPAIKNFREKKMLKEIFELRDQSTYSTYTYTYNEMTGKRIFFCNSIGYPIPYATQYTSPQKISVEHTQYGLIIPQADPNGLFSPGSADGTWVLCKDPNSNAFGPVYSEPKLITIPFKMD